MAKAADLDWKQKLKHLEAARVGKGTVRHDKVWKKQCVLIEKGKKKKKRGICCVNVTTSFHVVEVSAYVINTASEKCVCVSVCVLRIRNPP